MPKTNNHRDTENAEIAQREKTIGYVHVDRAREVLRQSILGRPLKLPKKEEEQEAQPA